MPQQTSLMKSRFCTKKLLSYWKASVCFRLSELAGAKSLQVMIDICMARQYAITGTLFDIEATASGGVTIEPPPLSYKKWRLTGNQTSNSSHISPGVLTSNPFDQMRTASILGGFQAEIRGSAPAMSCFVTVGSSPYAGFYYAIEVSYTMLR